MIYNNVQLFNVEEYQNWDKGAMLCRFPSVATKDMKDRASWMAHAANGYEVRFVCEAEGFWITLGAVAQDVDVYVMRGDYKNLQGIRPLTHYRALPEPILAGRQEKGAVAPFLLE